MPSVSALSRALLAAFVVLVCACAHESGSESSVESVTNKRVAEPMPSSESYAEQAMLVKLEKAQPAKTAGMYNLFRLSDQIISGSEPIGEEAFATLRRMGVRTILSVDGMPPSVELAQQYGMRYVHQPIQYSGLKRREILAIAKTFEELEGPFYVHCFHGKHRGPAAAAIGRVVKDGATRSQAIAEMRQWCGTATKYEGLYRTVARAPMPTAEELDGFAYEFPSVAPIEGIVPAMSKLARAHDHIRDLGKRDYAPDPDHPDIDLVNESKKLVSYLEVTRKQAEGEYPAEFLTWTDESIDLARELVQGAESLRAGDSSMIEATRTNFEAIRDRCASCHKAYRNN